MHAQSLNRVEIFVTYHGLLCPWDSPGKNTEVGCHVLLQLQVLEALISSNILIIISLLHFPNYSFSKRNCVMQLFQV